MVWIITTYYYINNFKCFSVDIQIGFTSDETVIEDNNLITIKVMILNGTLQMGLSIPFSLQIGIVNGRFYNNLLLV